MQFADYLTYIVRGLVDHPDYVDVIETTDEIGIVLTIHVHKDDMGSVVGRNGSTAQTLRTLLRNVGSKSRKRVSVMIAEPR